MKKLISGTVLGLVLLTNTYAYDNYAKYSILYTVPSDLKSTSSSGAQDTVEMKSGYALNIGLGQKVSKVFALETEYSYDQANTKGNNSNIKVHSLYLNGIYYPKIESDSMHPYIGIGLGGASYTDGTTDDTVFTYQGFTGVSFDTDHNIETFFEYKYKDFSSVKLDDISYDDTGIHAIGIGLKSKF